MDYSEKLKRIRKNLGLSQYALAMKMGVNRSTINRIENGLAEPDAKKKRWIDESYDSLFLDKAGNLEIKPSLDINEDVSHIVEASARNAFAPEFFDWEAHR